MVCPAEYDLGEDIKVDLLAYTNFDMEKAKRSALAINPELNIIAATCIDGTGAGKWVESILTSTV